MDIRLWIEISESLDLETEKIVLIELFVTVMSVG